MSVFDACVATDAETCEVNFTTVMSLVTQRPGER